MRQEKINQVAKEARVTKAVTAKIIANMKANMGRRATPVNNDDASMEEDEELSRKDVTNSTFVKQSQATGQEQKKQTTLTERNPLIKTVVFVEVRVT